MTFYLQWRNISVDIEENTQSFWRTKTRKKLILNNSKKPTDPLIPQSNKIVFAVSGYAKSGSLIAIMGASGAGKTTFLGAISGRVKNFKGFLKINENFLSDNIKNISNYIQQNDIFTESMTVFENLHLMAAFRLGNKKNSETMSIIDQLLIDLDLDKKKNSFIRYLSGGERRKLSLAEALLDNPQILFCDEPTTGLDSFGAVNILQKLKTIAKKDKIVLITIHQPSSQLYNLFDDIILLSCGRIVFAGPREQAKSFFDSIHLNCPTSYNPADYYIRCLSDSNRANKIYRAFNKIQQQNQINDQLKFNNNLNFSLSHPAVSNSFLFELRWLSWRAFINMKRNIINHMIGYICLLATACFLAISYATVEINGKNSVQNIQGVFVYMMSEIIFTSMYAVIYIFPQEITIFLKEKALYSPLPYYISKVLSLIPLCLLSPMCVLTVFFIFVKFLNGFYLYLSILYLLFCCSLSASAIGLSFSATFSSIEYIDLVLTPVEIILMIMSGIWIRIDQLPFAYSWIKYLSPFFYGFESLSVIYWTNNNNENCKRNETASCYSTGDEVLKIYGFLTNYNTIIYNFVYLHLIMIAFCAIGFAGIIRKRAKYNVY